MIPKGTVQRLIFGEGLPRTEHRTRDMGVLFDEAEWGWSRDSGDAYVFQQYEAGRMASSAYEVSAESHAAALREAGEKNVHPCVYSSTSQKLRDMRDEDRARVTERSAQELLSPEKVYAATAARMGERD